MLASVWFSGCTVTCSFASSAWCSPSLNRLPSIMRPVNSSISTTLSSRTM